MHCKQRRKNRWGVYGRGRSWEGRQSNEILSVTDRRGDSFLEYDGLHEQKRRAQREVVRKRVGALVRRGDMVRRVGIGDRRGSTPLRKSLVGSEVVFPKDAVSSLWRSGTGSPGTPGRASAKRFRFSKKRRRTPAPRRGGLRVTEVWINGRLTNHAGFRAYVARQAGRRKNALAFGDLGNSRRAGSSEGSGTGSGGVAPSTASTRWYDLHRKEREKWLSEPRAHRPGLVVLLEAPSQRVARREAQRCGIPTVGRVPVGTAVPGRTYPRPMPGHGGASREREGRLLLGRRIKTAVLYNEKYTSKV
jgi:hypothetical protein